MTVAYAKHTLNQALFSIKEAQESIGLVPTMGALHEGHLALVSRALQDNEHVVVSIFVNPTQFNNVKDLELYPRHLDQDITKLERISSRIIVFAPEIDDLYGSHVVSDSYALGTLIQDMEGKFRPGHFDGVATIVHKLLDVVQPERAYFGEKDYQQLQVIRKVVSQKNIATEIIGCPIYREKSGLAMSSRNERLSKDQKVLATQLHHVLVQVKEKFGIKSVLEIRNMVQSQFSQQKEIQLEYFEIAATETMIPTETIQPHTTYRAFISAFIGGVRLIDNIALN